MALTRSERRHPGTQEMAGGALALMAPPVSGAAALAEWHSQSIDRQLQHAASRASGETTLLHYSRHRSLTYIFASTTLFKDRVKGFRLIRVIGRTPRRLQSTERLN
ncbi:hypothetical protein AAFF_G00213960 [Aldrovandia affinis]|uniref:Uncharacterized protein n=1 Tax=Aldrovandia affinis TaxID=143900 RepID=A0AAD7RJB0_9TELE|nr:hypothetical protein AAFF_G00213960 [Aldrovandia affinis]